MISSEKWRFSYSMLRIPWPELTNFFYHLSPFEREIFFKESYLIARLKIKKTAYHP